jgi:K+-sensing histidine kinase KdpD
VRFSVRDTGPGIARDDLPHVFERFRRGRDVGYAGAGLGLAIAKGDRGGSSRLDRGREPAGRGCPLQLRHTGARRAGELG